jgi:hypothetical protein
MKKIILIIITVLTGFGSFSQKIKGQWRGFFDSNGDIVLNAGNNTEYVLELEISGSKVSGYSYSYFQGRRYYVICQLDGVFYSNSKSIKVTETERIKGNTPPDFSDCLQVHYLTYSKDSSVEKLSGYWKSAPGQRAGCGDGTTTLIRRTLSNDLSSYNKTKKEPPAIANKPATKPGSVSNKKPVAPPATVKAIPATPGKPKITAPIVKTKPKPKVNNTVTAPPVVRATPEKKEMPSIITPEIKRGGDSELKPITEFEKRKSDLLKTIQIENETFTVDLYDNGEVDGDSVSVFYNGKLILSHKKLSEKAISLKLDATTDKVVNELTMYAENLGEIPPNTALMVVTDGDKRYEVRISSDYKNSGTIHFVHNSKTQ